MLPDDDALGVEHRLLIRLKANTVWVSELGKRVERPAVFRGRTIDFKERYFMFGEQSATRKVIGDVDVVYHEGLYHLFHLVLPNHDFIAHAVSENGVNWRRIRNALFISDPGNWDDLMLWTMHVSPDPHRPGMWRMFYTGLSRREHGSFQRIGLAESNDLYSWRKVSVNWLDHRGPHDPPRVKQARLASEQEGASATHAPCDCSSCFPLEPDPEFYEASPDGGREWVSCRDPFYFRDEKRAWLLAAARVNHGPLVRRGCVGLYEEVGPNQLESRPPLHHPELYDDIEVPNLLMLNQRYYLIGSIREDAKVRYWQSETIDGVWQSPSDNVLLARGNYAGRVCYDDQGPLLWSFFSFNPHERTRNNLLLPPKRLTVDDRGQLTTQTFHHLQDFLRDPIETMSLVPLKDVMQGDSVKPADGSDLKFVSPGRFQAFVFKESLESFQFQGHLKLMGEGKCGMIFRIDPLTHDGYYLSLDLKKGVAQLRAWGTDTEHVGEEMMQFCSLQEGYWIPDSTSEVELKLIAFGSYLECSINGRVLLSLADQTYCKGALGIYVESAELILKDPQVHRLQSPTQSDAHLAEGYSKD